MKILNLLPADGRVAVYDHPAKGVYSRPLLALVLVEESGEQRLDGLLSGRGTVYASHQPGFIGIYNRLEARRLAAADNSDRWLAESRAAR